MEMSLIPWTTLRILFFFYWYCTPRDLHSFPTRRSSDLRLIAGLPGPNSERPALARRPSIRMGSAVRTDRKSTRLNSSHVKISYAVFCLKKKNMVSAFVPQSVLDEEYKDFGK